jgi:hypothetical protein
MAQYAADALCGVASQRCSTSDELPDDAASLEFIRMSAGQGVPHSKHLLVPRHFVPVKFQFLRSGRPFEPVAAKFVRRADVSQRCEPSA